MRNARRNWITSLLGGLVLAMVGVKVYQKPATLTAPETTAAIAMGVGLIASKDANKSGTVTLDKLNNRISLPAADPLPDRMPRSRGADRLR